jgi:polyphosphate kinase
VVQPNLTPLMIDSLPVFPTVNDHHIYLAVKCSNKKEKKDERKTRYSLIDVPTHVCPRFVVLPKEDERHCIILLDDIIRYNLEEIFYLFEYEKYEAYTIKVTRDAELDLDNDVSTSFIEKLAKSIRKREVAKPVRLIYDEKIPKMVSYPVGVTIILRILSISLIWVLKTLKTQHHCQLSISC